MTTPKQTATHNTAQANEVARILSETCAVLDGLVTLGGRPSDVATRVIARMRAYLDRRGPVQGQTEPEWVARMRRTVAWYEAKPQEPGDPADMDVRIHFSDSVASARSAGASDLQIASTLLGLSIAEFRVSVGMSVPDVIRTATETVRLMSDEPAENEHANN